VLQADKNPQIDEAVWQAGVEKNPTIFQWDLPTLAD